MNLFIWDFHGVLEKGNDVAVTHISNEALKIHGFNEQFTQAESDFCSGLKWFEYFTWKIPSLPIEKALEIQKTCIDISGNQFEKILKYIKPNDHSVYTLKNIKSKGNSQILISNTQQHVLKSYLETTKLINYFDEYFGADAHKVNVKLSKKDILNEYLKDKTFNKIITIGDSEGDVSLIGDIKNSISYLYSYPHRKHKTEKGHIKITDLREVLQELD